MLFCMNSKGMDLNAVRMLVRVAEARSFTVAAGQLGVSQSGLSRAIGRLEATLGVKLLQRTTRNVGLTPDGRQFVEQVAPLLGGLDEAERQLADRSCTPSGTLRISAPSMFGRKVLVPLLAPLLARYPQLRVETVLSDRLVDLVEEGFDVALRTGPIADRRIVARPLRPLRWVTVASPAYLAARGAPADLETLRDHACLAIRNPRSGRLVNWQFLQDGATLRIRAAGTDGVRPRRSAGGRRHRRHGHRAGDGFRSGRCTGRRTPATCAAGIRRPQPHAVDDLSAVTAALGQATCVDGSAAGRELVNPLHRR